jgi:hypothetical protein
MKTLSKKELQKWLKIYDFNKYPSTIYEDLVFDGITHENKYIILGAWKTGCLRRKNGSTFYSDSAKYTYGVTNRWKIECPVGFGTWSYLNENRDWFETALPSRLSDSIPEAIKALADRSGFGFVWAVFAAHCHLPRVYPLYDQHVYRAYKAIQSNELELPEYCPANWQEYLKYATFFRKQMMVAGMSQVDCDRALWAYGKQLKIKKNKANRVEIHSSRTLNYTKMNEDFFEDYVHSVTLGGKAKSFWWAIEDNCLIKLCRKFNQRTGKLSNTKVIDPKEINALLEYLGKFELFSLANDVQKLKNGTEREDGIGFFLHNKLQWSTTDSQLASQLGSIFFNAVVWDSNGLQRNIKFNFIDVENWGELIHSHYKELLRIDEDNE